MGVFSATEIVSVIYRCKDRMKNLAKLLFDDSQEEQIKKYLQACDKRDSDVINAAIDNAFCRFFLSQSVEEGVIRFVERFPELNIDLDDEIFEKDIITKAAKYGDIMLQIIDENYRNASGRR